jgi:hypothetical protein
MTGFASIPLAVRGADDGARTRDPWLGKPIRAHTAQVGPSPLHPSRPLPARGYQGLWRRLSSYTGGSRCTTHVQSEIGCCLTRERALSEGELDGSVGADPEAPLVTGEQSRGRATPSESAPEQSGTA